MARARCHLHALGLSLLATLLLVAILSPVASASSSLVAGHSPAASLVGRLSSADCASSSPPVTVLSTVASASPSPLVAKLCPTARVSSWPHLTGLSTVAARASSSRVVTGLSTAACVSSSPPVTGGLSTAASSSAIVAKLSPTACASSSRYRTRRGSRMALGVADTCVVSLSAEDAERDYLRHAPGSTTCGTRSSSSTAAANATVGSATSTTTTADDEAKGARSESVESIWYGCSASASPPPADEPARATTSATISLPAATAPTSTASSSSPGRMLVIVSVVAAILAAAGGWAIGGQQQRWCELCFMEKKVFHLNCCRKSICNVCLHDFVRGTHNESCKGLAAGRIVPLLHPRELQIGGLVPEGYAHLPEYPPWYFAKSVKNNSRIHLFYYHLQELELGAEPRVMEVIHLAYPDGISAAIRSDIYPMMRAFSEL